VKPQLRILDGARAGHTAVYSKRSIALGRHPSVDLQFDPEGDLEVSARHATVLRKGDKWFVRDLGSTNGTFVNGHRIRGDTNLDDTDQVRLGKEGPRIEVRLVPDSTADGVSQQAATSSTPHPPGQPLRPTGAARPSTTERIRVEVGRQTKNLRNVIGVLALVLITVAAGFIYFNRQQQARRAAEIAQMQAHTDSIIRASEAAIRALQGEVEGLATRLRASRSEVTRLQGNLSTAVASGNADEVELLRTQLDAATQALEYQQDAAQVDYRGIVDRNQSAVALIWVDFGSDRIHTGTAFAVRSDGVLLTNRHVVAGESGTERPRRIAVRFADSDQTWRGRVLATSQDVDLAVVKVDLRSPVPTVQGLNSRPDTLRQGDPVAVVGFPLGTELPMSGAVARTSFSAGSVSKVLVDVLQVDGYGASGASGSPIFDRTGQVVGVLYGGRDDSDGRIVFGVPSSHAIQMLQRVP
jgi:S1-C subfamily serine protease